MTCPAIVTRVIAATEASSAYRSVIAQTEGDPVMRTLMLDGLAFDVAKDIADAQTARRASDIYWRTPTEAALGIAVGDRMVCIRVCVVTRMGRVMSDERTVAA